MSSSSKMHTYLNVIPVNRVLRIGLLIILAVAATAGFAWIQTDPVIAPPGLRVLDWLWKVIIS